MIVKYSEEIIKNIKAILKYLAKNCINEKGYSIYIKGDKMYVQRDKGYSVITVSDFSKINKEVIPFLVNPDKVILMHTHPFEDIPFPSMIDLLTAKRFREYYKNVECYVIGRKKVTKY